MGQQRRLEKANRKALECLPVDGQIEVSSDFSEEDEDDSSEEGLPKEGVDEIKARRTVLEKLTGGFKKGIVGAQAPGRPDLAKGLEKLLPKSVQAQIGTMNNNLGPSAVAGFTHTGSGSSFGMGSQAISTGPKVLEPNALMPKSCPVCHGDWDALIKKSDSPVEIQPCGCYVCEVCVTKAWSFKNPTNIAFLKDQTSTSEGTT